MARPIGLARRNTHYRASQILWTPVALGSALVAWWDATDSTTLTMSGGTVSAWADKKAGLAAQQPTASKQPSYSATGLNGKPAIVGAGSQYMDIASASAFPGGSAAGGVFVAFSGSSDGSSNNLFLSWGDGSSYKTDERLWGWNNAKDKFWYTGLAQGFDLAGNASVLNTPAIGYADDSGGTSPNGTLYQNGTLASSINGGSQMSTTLSAGARLGYSNDPYCSPFTGAIGCLGVTNQVLTTSQRQKLEGYMAWTFGLQTSSGGVLPAGHPYVSRAPLTSDP